MTHAIVAPVTDGRTYKRLLYLLLAFPLGVAWFCFYVTGLSLGAGLAITIVGLPILIAVLASVVPFAALERDLANALLEEDIARPAAEPPLESLWARVKRLVTASRTWKELGFLLARFPLGVFSFTAVITALGVSLGLAAAPLYAWAAPIDIDGFLRIDTVGEALPLVPVGLVLTVIALHLTNLLARAYGAFARVSLR